MAKRFIERPTARQIVDRAEREAQYERGRDLNADWMAANYAQPAPAPKVKRDRLDIVDRLREIESADSYARFCDFHREYETFDIPDCKSVTPGLVKVSRKAEPKSIHSHAPSGPIRFERPKPRRKADPADRGMKDCEIPEYRRHQTYTIEDSSGRARGAIQINPFSKRINIGGFGLTTRK